MICFERVGGSPNFVLLSCFILVVGKFGATEVARMPLARAACVAIVGPLLFLFCAGASGFGSEPFVAFQGNDKLRIDGDEFLCDLSVGLTSGTMKMDLRRQKANCFT